MTESWLLPVLSDITHDGIYKLEKAHSESDLCASPSSRPACVRDPDIPMAKEGEDLVAPHMVDHATMLTISKSSEHQTKLFSAKFMFVLTKGSSSAGGDRRFFVFHVFTQRMVTSQLN